MKEYLNYTCFIYLLCAPVAFSMESDWRETDNLESSIEQFDEQEQIDNPELYAITCYNPAFKDTIIEFLNAHRNNPEPQKMLKKYEFVIDYMNNGYDIKSLMFQLSAFLNKSQYKLEDESSMIVKNAELLTDLILGKNSVGTSEFLPQGITSSVLEMTFKIFRGINTINLDVSSLKDPLMNSIKHASNLRSLTVERSIKLSVVDLQKLSGLPLEEMYFYSNDLDEDENWSSFVNLIGNLPQLKEINFSYSRINEARLTLLLNAFPRLSVINVDTAPQSAFNK